MGGWSSSGGGTVPSSRTGPETITSADSGGLALTLVGPSSTPAVIGGNSPFRPASVILGYVFAGNATGPAFSGNAAGNFANCGSDGTNFLTVSSGSYTWTASTLGNSKDTGLSRNAAGVVEVNNATPGTLRDIKVRSTIQSPPASVAPAVNGEFVVEATSNTTLTFKLKGTDGTVRSATLTLA